MKIIGLTGGIGAGKSTVSDFLREKGYMILDADLIAHQITEKGSDTLVKIADVFGQDMILPDGNLDRKKLASIVFTDKDKKAQLEEITTKEVINIIKDKLHYLRNEGNYDIIFVDAPLLYESGADKLTDLVWLVTADQEVRISRVVDRDQATREEVLCRIANQMDRAEKEKRAREVIDNSKGKEELYQQVEYLLMKYAESK